MDREPVIRLRGISKVYPDGVRALSDVSLDIYPGEVLGLLGENGAGKTTLMRILYGEIRPTTGKIFLKGREVRFHGPWDAIRHGIRMIYQHFSLVEGFTALENIHLFLTTLNKGAEIEETRKKAEEIMRDLNFSIPLDEPVEDLPIGVQQKVEIVKSLVSGAEVLILDEPTSVLNPLEARELFNLIRKLRERGVSVIFISHKLREIMEVTDRVVVLRKGRKVGEAPTSEVNEIALAKMMVGEDIRVEAASRPARGGGPRKPVLALENVFAKGDREQSSLKGVSLVIYSGEIVGVAGVQGNGQRELAEVIIGLRKPTSGRILLEGEDITSLPVRERMKRGIALIPESRKLGLVAEMDISGNVLLTNYIRLVRRGVVSSRELEELSRKIIEEYEVVAPSSKVLVKHLSGGNQQRVMVGRELARGPRVLVAMEPTHGLDVKSTNHIRSLLASHRDAGGSVLLISSDLEELLSLSDRLLIMYGGRIVAEGHPSEFTVERIGLCMGGSC